MYRIIIFVIIAYSAVFASEKEFEMVEVAKHSISTDCWIVIKNKVYDISSYIPKHPAPETVLTKYCGKVADLGWDTKDKKSTHSRAAKRLLDRYEVGAFTK